MSGHNKWSKIKNKKGAADAKKGAVFTRLAKALTLAAREGGGDVSMNFKLRVAVDAARAANMPNDNIDRAIARGTGEEGAGEMHAGVYEAYGPGGAAIVIETLSDNKNRVVAEVTTALKKAGATPADQGSVLFNFDRKAVVSAEGVSLPSDQAAFELGAIDAGADDLLVEEGGIELVGEPSALQSLVEFLEQQGMNADEASLQYRAKAGITLDEDAQAKLDRIVEVLEELDDVQAVYTSVV